MSASLLMNFREYYYNDSISFINDNIFLYDIRSCYYRILKNILNIDIGQWKDKAERNIKIGLLFKENPDIQKEVVKINKDSMINFIKENNLSDNDILFIERDGLAIKKYVGKQKFDDRIWPEFREHYKITIRSLDKKNSYILLNNDKAILKGAKYKTVGIERYLYETIHKLLSMNYENMFKKMNKLRLEYFNNDDIDLFKIPVKEGYKILLKNNQTLTIRDEHNLNFKNLPIDKYVYYKEHVEGFIKSMIYELR